MVSLEVKNKEIAISSIGKADVLAIKQWIDQETKKQRDNTEMFSFEMNEFMRRFIEYYICDGEVFFKIEKEQKVIGIIKGRLEQRDEFFIWFMMLGSDYRNKGLGSASLELITNYIKKNYGIKSISAGVCAGNTSAISFWKKEGFEAIRTTKDFFEWDAGSHDLVVYRKNIL